MSLDVYLEGNPCSHCGRYDETFWQNYTHNAGKIAAEAGIYECVWRPDENGITLASQLIDPLRKGIELMKSDPERFKAFNPANGWGDYDSFLVWCEKYLAACEENPTAGVRVSR